MIRPLLQQSNLEDIYILILHLGYSVLSSEAECSSGEMQNTLATNLALTASAVNTVTRQNRI